MRTDMLFRFNFSFESWVAVLDGNNVDYVRAGSEMGTVVSSAGAMTLSAKDQLPIGSQVRNLKDKKGTPILVLNGVEYPAYVHRAEPQFSPFSELIGWRHTLKREQPRDLVKMVADGLVS